MEVYRTTSITDGVPTFAPSPETYFVGTAPASVTVADINGDGIPDLLVANQGSNDVSVIFGSYNANGDWVGIPGPRLKSGGDGPIAVIVADLTDNSVPRSRGRQRRQRYRDPAAGRRRRLLRRPRSQSSVQPWQCRGPTTHLHGHERRGLRGDRPWETWCGSTSTIPSAGASVVYSGQQVVAAQALTSGQVVVALADGVVDLLVPQGNGLSVGSQLLADGATPSLPSSIEVLAKANGLFDVLVSSRGL